MRNIAASSDDWPCAKFQEFKSMLMAPKVPKKSGGKNPKSLGKQ